MASDGIGCWRERSSVEHGVHARERSDDVLDLWRKRLRVLHRLRSEGDLSRYVDHRARARRAGAERNFVTSDSGHGIALR